MQKRGLGVRDRQIEQLANLFHLLSDQTRLKIMMLLTKGELNVTSLCEQLGLPQPTVSHHLGLMRMSNLISNRRHGKQVFYGLNGHVEASGENEVRVPVESFEVLIREQEPA